MDNQRIINTIRNKHSDSYELCRSLQAVMHHIERCKEYNIDMLQDDLLSKILLFN